MAGVILVNATMVTVVPVRNQVDAWVEFAVTLLLEGRSWPVFALMFGWGLAASAASLGRRGHDRAVVLRTLRRRGGWLVAFGFVQSLLYFNLDILGVYGLTAVVLAGMVFWSTRTLVGLAALSLMPWTVILAATMLWEDPDPGAREATSYLAALLERVGIFVAGMTLATLALAIVPPMIVGIMLLRRGALHRPGDHRLLHRRVAGWGMLLGLVGGAPWALVDAGWWEAGGVGSSGALFLHMLTGMAQGAAYVSVIALVAAGSGEHSRVTRGFAAIGQRSLTVYLLHAVLLAFTLSPWALDLTAHLTLAQTYAWALTIWCLCALAVLLLQAAGRTGPAERVLRRLVDRRVPPV